MNTVGVVTKLIWDHPSNAGRRARAVAAAVLWQLYKRTIARPFDIDAFGFRFRCYADSHEASRMLYFNGQPDPAEMTFLRRYLRPGDHVIDAGANVGVYTLLFASLVGPGGRILAFEPDRVAQARLAENVTSNALSNVTIRTAAIADFAGEADFNLGSDTGNSLSEIRPSDRGSQKVAVVTLDAEIAGTPFALCKMDVEGAEFAALKGAVQSIGAANPPVWLLELTNRTLGRSGTSVEEVRRWLDQHGFGLWRYDRDDNNLEPWQSRPRRPGHVGDAIAVAESQLDAVRARLAQSRGKA